MVNHKLLQVLTPEKLTEMGFVEENDGSESFFFDDPRGVDYNIRNKNFHVMIDFWGEVFIRRINPDTDFITVHCETLHDLQELLNWIEN